MKWHCGGLVIALGLVLTAAGPIHANFVVQPIVVEQFDFDEQRIEYTVVNPLGGSVEYVGLIIEAVDLGWTDTDPANGWMHAGLSDPASSWDNTMFGYPSDYTGPSVGYDLTWAEFFGIGSYPLGSVPAAVFFMSYSETGATGVYEFDDPGQAIASGESLDQFFAYFSLPTSDYLLSSIGDAGGTFGDTTLTSFQGTAIIPEPTTLVMVAVAGCCLLRRRR